VFARHRSRIQHAIVEIGEASSCFLQFVPMPFAAINPASSSTVIATRCSAYAGPNAGPVHGRLDVPSARDLLSQH